EAEKVDKGCIINHGQIATCGSPEEMKKSLLRQQLVLDADDRDGLLTELSELGLFHKTEAHIIVPYQEMRAQEIIARLQTRLSVLKIEEPSLEDAYIEYLKLGDKVA
ncbi:MAG: ABC transporter ATP-binding protein, partial [Ethanoligenens sp.]